jgi:hypothetical protein
VFDGAKRLLLISDYNTKNPQLLEDRYKLNVNVLLYKIRAYVPTNDGDLIQSKCICRLGRRVCFWLATITSPFVVFRNHLLRF